MANLDQKDVVETTQESPKSNKMKLVTAAAIITLATATQAQTLLEKCIAYDSDINNNWEVTKFEKKICYTKMDAAWLVWEWKRLDEEWRKLDKDINWLDKDIKKIRKIKELLAQK